MAIQGKVVLIVGSSGAIGSAIAKEFVRRKAVVALASRSMPAAAFFEEIAIPQDQWLQIDVTDLRSIEKAMELLEDRLGRIEFMVNASGVYGPIGPLKYNDPSAWVDAVQTNIVGAFNLMHAVIPQMSRHGGGRVLHFSGGGGLYGRPFFTCYSACKAAIVRLTESVALELKDQNIFVNAIAPGPVKSRMWDELRSAGAAAGNEALQELQSLEESGGVSADRAASLAVALCETSLPITGKVISAIWDDWEHLESYAEEILTTPAWTLRRTPLQAKP